MLQLFLSISLYPFQQRSQSHLLTFSQRPLLLYEFPFQWLLIELSLIFLHLIGLIPAHFSIFILPHRKEYLFLCPHLHQLLRPVQLSLCLIIHLLRQWCQLLHVFFLQPLDRLKRRRFIVCHVLIPGIIKFLKLHFLCAFNSGKLLFLGDSHVLSLPLALEGTELFETVSELFGSTVFLISLCSFLQLVHYPKE
jgi:hypothetical protein